MPDVQMVNATQLGARPIALTDAAVRYAELFAAHAGDRVAVQPPAAQ